MLLGVQMKEYLTAKLSLSFEDPQKMFSVFRNRCEVDAERPSASVAALHRNRSSITRMWGCLSAGLNRVARQAIKKTEHGIQKLSLVAPKIEMVQPWVTTMW